MGESRVGSIAPAFFAHIEKKNPSIIMGAFRGVGMGLPIQPTTRRSDRLRLRLRDLTTFRATGPRIRDRRYTVRARADLRPVIPSDRG